MIALAANKLFTRSKFKKAILANFDLMIILVTNKLFMRSGDRINIRNFYLMKSEKII
jgi:hypothetical protein